MPRSEPIGSDNIAPWGSPTRMRVLAVVTVVGGLLLAFVGLDLIAQHHNGGWTIFAFGGGALLLMGSWSPWRDVRARSNDFDDSRDSWRRHSCCSDSLA
jgi:hypothetical protein